MARKMRVYVPVKRKPSRSMLGRRRYAATHISTEHNIRVTHKRGGGIVRGVIHEVTGTGYRLGWRTRPWI